MQYIAIMLGFVLLVLLLVLLLMSNPRNGTGYTSETRAAHAMQTKNSCPQVRTL
jgi:hypothetical protein